MFKMEGSNPRILVYDHEKTTWTSLRRVIILKNSYGEQDAPIEMFLVTLGDRNVNMNGR